MLWHGYTTGEAQISLSHSTKLLGMIVEDTLSWNKHFTELIGALKRRLYTIRRIAYQIPRDKIIKLLRALWMSKLRYGLQFQFQWYLFSRNIKCTRHFLKIGD